MRTLTFLPMLLVLLGCDPRPTMSPTDFPQTYQRSKIEWSNLCTAVFQGDGLDTLEIKGAPVPASWSSILEQQPFFAVSSVHLNNEDQASLLLSNQEKISTLRYQTTADYLHLWFPHNPDEQYYFHYKPEDSGMNRSFIVYWKLAEYTSVPTLYFRGQDEMDFWVERVLSNHQLYDPFLEDGDTVKIMSGSLFYEKK